MQIAQFILGFTYAGLHLFVYYNSPTSTSYSLLHTITAAIPSATSAVANAASTASAAIVSGGVGGLLKKLAYRAAGEEGLAENVRNKEGYIFGPEAQHLAETIKSETRYRETWEKTPCIDTSGQAFAIYINLVYLLPLT